MPPLVRAWRHFHGEVANPRSVAHHTSHVGCRNGFSGRARLLVVDDQPDAREAIAAVLEQFGAMVTTAESAEEAVEIIRAEHTDAVLADIAMPGDDGIALLSRLHAGGLAIPPAAALTAFGPEHRDRILAAGYQRYLPKPVLPPALAAAVRDLAARRAS